MEKKIHKNPYFNVILKNDYYSIVFHQESVLILPVIENSYILFIRPIRPVLKKATLELPAGGVEKGETVKGAGLRELYEETGIKILNDNRLVPLPSLNLMPNRTLQMLNVFQINLTKTEYENRESHDHEILETKLLSLGEIVPFIQKGEINAGAAVATSLYYLVNNNTFSWR